MKTKNKFKPYKYQYTFYLNSSRAQTALFLELGSNYRIIAPHRGDVCSHPHTTEHYIVTLRTDLELSLIEKVLNSKLILDRETDLHSLKQTSLPLSYHITSSHTVN